MKNPYEALDLAGLPYLREAITIHELPVDQRKQALDKMGKVIEKEVGMRYCEKFTVRSGSYGLCFGIPLYEHFAITRNQAKDHPKSYLLLRYCQDLPLALLNEYKAAITEAEVLIANARGEA